MKTVPVASHRPRHRPVRRLDYPTRSWPPRHPSSLVEIHLETGRHHQIRVQMSAPRTSHPRGPALWGSRPAGAEANRPRCVQAHHLSPDHQRGAQHFLPAAQGLAMAARSTRLQGTAMGLERAACADLFLGWSTKFLFIWRDYEKIAPDSPSAAEGLGFRDNS